MLPFHLGRRSRRLFGSEDVISVWNRSASNTEGIEKIRESVKRLLKIPLFVQVKRRWEGGAKTLGHVLEEGFPKLRFA